MLVVLPGSRTSEVSRLMQPFGAALELLHCRRIRPQVIIPAVPHVRPLIERHVQSWTVKPHIVEGEEDKFRAFKLAHAALAASGTVTLELRAGLFPLAAFVAVNVTKYCAAEKKSGVQRNVTVSESKVAPRGSPLTV